MLALLHPFSCTESCLHLSIRHAKEEGLPPSADIQFQIAPIPFDMLSQIPREETGADDCKRRVGPSEHAVATARRESVCHHILKGKREF